MKTTIRIFALAAVLAVVAGAMPTVQANYIPAKVLTTFGEGGYAYINLPAGSNTANVVGRFWQKGSRSLANEGAYDDSQWLRSYTPSGGGDTVWYISANLGDAAVFGCPSGNLVLKGAMVKIN